MAVKVTSMAIRCLLRLSRLQECMCVSGTGDMLNLMIKLTISDSAIVAIKGIHI